MARTLTLLLLAPLCTLLTAGSGGPDAYGYTWKDDAEPGGPVFNWVDITSTGTRVTGLGDDNVVGPFVMGTDFGFYWYERKNLWIGSNGYIAFNSGNIASPFPSIPLAGGVNDFITGVLSDLNFSGSNNPGECWFHDEAGRTIVSFINVPFWRAAAPSWVGSNTFQIILDKTDMSITVQVLQQTGMTSNNDITIGIESVAGTIGLQHSKNAYPPANRAIRFEMPATPLITVTDATIAWNGQVGNGGRFATRGGAPVPLVTNVANIGNTDLGTFTVTGTVFNALNQQQLNTQRAVGPLAAGADTTVVYGEVWSPNTAGTFRLRSTISGIPNELVTTNNQRVLELVVIDTTLVTQNLNYHGPNDDGTGLSWSGGSGGVGVHIVPPYHPVTATATTARIAANANAVPFVMKVYRDDGPDGGPGSLLDSVMVPGAQATPGDKVVPLSTPVTIGSGGVYVMWDMQGEGVAIARDDAAPFSLRTYEVLGNTWAQYRDREATDFHIGLRLTRMDVGIGERTAARATLVPNPARDQVRIEGLPAGDYRIQLSDAAGRVVLDTRRIASQGPLTVAVDGLPTGFYQVRLDGDGGRFHAALVVER